MPALDFQTLLRQERNRVRHEMDQTNNKTRSGSPRAEESEEGDQHDDDDKEDTTCVNFAARVDALLDSVMASHVQSAAPEDGDMDIMATAAAKVVEEGEQVRHCLRARLNPEYLTRATTERDLSKHAMRGPPDGVFYVPEYISKEMEQEIMEVAHSMPVNQWVKLRGRRLQCFGGKPTENVRSFQSEALPPWIGQVCRTLMLAGVFDEEIIPNHVLLNEYEPGQGIMAHADGPFYHSRVAIISLGGPAIFRFKRRLIAEEISADSQESGPAGTVVLEPRSLIVFEGEAYHDYLHEIAAVEEEVVGGTEGTTPVLNLERLEGRINVGDRLKRALRLSLTCRRVKEEGEVKDQDDAN